MGANYEITEIFCRLKKNIYLAVKLECITTKNSIAYRRNSTLETTKIKEYECDYVKRPSVA